MLFLSKSKYCNLWQCPKITWLNKFKPDVKTEDPSLEQAFAVGHEVGEQAKELFGTYSDMTRYENDCLNITRMIEDTKKELEKGTEVICEAAFSYNGLYCAVDILKREGEGWAIYEVKSSTNNAETQEAKNVYIADISYQRYVLEHCGIHVTGTYLVCINNQYVRGEDLDVRELFYVMNIAELVDAEIHNVEPNIKLAEKILNSSDEPDYDLAERCRNPYECAYWEYCSRNLPEKSVFDLYRMSFDKKIDLYRKGFISYQ